MATATGPRRSSPSKLTRPAEIGKTEPDIAIILSLSSSWAARGPAGPCELVVSYNNLARGQRRAIGMPRHPGNSPIDPRRAVPLFGPLTGLARTPQMTASIHRGRRSIPRLGGPFSRIHKDSSDEDRSHRQDRPSSPARPRVSATPSPRASPERAPGSLSTDGRQKTVGPAVDRLKTALPAAADRRRRRRRRHRRRLRRAGSGRPDARHPGQQCRHLRAQGLLRDSRRGLDPLLRDQRHVGRAAVARLYARHARAQLGPDRLHLVGIRP